jgi:hypothetical protein
MTKDKKIQDYRDYITTYEKVMTACVELLQALETHTGKMVDKRFFEKHFTVMSDGHTYVRYSFYGKRYDFDTYNYSLYLGSGNNGERLELQTRETRELVEKLQKRHGECYEMIESYTAKITELENFDEQALVNDLIAVYEKHGKPEVWGKVLESYEVKYPS